MFHQLEQAEQPVTINNIEAMQELVSGSAYGRIFGADRNKAEKIIDSMSDEKSLRERQLRVWMTKNQKKHITIR